MKQAFYKMIIFSKYQICTSPLPGKRTTGLMTLKVGNRSAEGIELFYAQSEPFR